MLTLLMDSNWRFVVLTTADSRDDRVRCEVSGVVSEIREWLKRCVKVDEGGSVKNERSDGCGLFEEERKIVETAPVYATAAKTH
jgi:hypothetical protein